MKIIINIFSRFNLKANKLENVAEEGRLKSEQQQKKADAEKEDRRWFAVLVSAP
jgi:hypothetical protein